MITLSQGLYSKFHDPYMNFFYGSEPMVKYVGARLVHAGTAPSHAIAGILDGVMGVKDAVKFIFGGATDDEGWFHADLRLGCLEECFSGAFRQSISVINIDSKFYTAEGDDSDIEEFDELEKPYIPKEGHGILTEALVYNVLKNYAKNCTKNKNVVGAKLTYTIMIPTAIVTRITDLAIGILAVVGAFFWFGTQKSINHLAYRGLQITGIFYDIFYCTARLVNLKAGLQ